MLIFNVGGVGGGGTLAGNEGYLWLGGGVVVMGGGEGEIGRFLK